MARGPRPSERQRRLGQNFLADPNLLEAIVREAQLSETDVVLEVGAGGGALTGRLAPGVACIHAVETDERLRPELEPVASAAGNVNLVWGDALKLDLAGLAPAPTAMVSNLPYSIATPLLLRTISELPSVERWLVMIQLEIAERLRAEAGTRTYGSPSAIVQLACDVELVRKVDRAVFTPRPRVDSALLRMRRRAPAPSDAVWGLIRAAFAHRRKSAARSMELAHPGSLDAARAGLAELGLPEDSRAEALTPEQLVAVAERVEGEA